MAAQPIGVAAGKEAAQQLLILPSRRFHPRRYRPGGQSAWSGHLPFANDLVNALRPPVLVELGTHYGQSYFGFCQAVEENGVDCVCHAVDTWRGDSHSGFYGESVFHEVREYNAAHYSAFSYLLRGTFDEAHAHFADSSIGLLHIDGLHTYEAVKRDFELWLPKMKPGGVVLLHDIAVRHADFEVWKFWDEVRSQFDSFDFTHSWGLGVIRVGGAREPENALLSNLFRNSPEDRQAIREHYSFAADFLELNWRATQAGAATAPKSFLQVFGAAAGVYSESGSARAEIEPGAWRDYIVELPQGSETSELRFDPMDSPGIVELSAIAVRSAESHGLLFRYDTAEALAACTAAGDLTLLPPGEHLRFLSYGYDPQLLVTAPEGVKLNLPIQVELSMRAVMSLEGAAPAREIHPTTPSEIQEAIVERALALNRVETMRAELRHEQTERLALTSEIHRLSAAGEALAAESQAAKQSLAKEQNLRVRLEQEAAVLRLTVARHDAEVARVETERAQFASSLLRSQSQLHDALARGEALDSERAKRLHLEEQASILRVQSVRLDSDLEAARFREFDIAAQLASEKAASLAANKEIHEARAHLQADLETARAIVSGLERDLSQLQLRFRRERLEWDAARNSLERRGRELAAQRSAFEAECLRLETELGIARAKHRELLESYSWRFGRPLRALYGVLGSTKK